MTANFENGAGFGSEFPIHVLQKILILRVLKVHDAIFYGPINKQRHRALDTRNTLKPVVYISKN